jgi:hypothetical protein
MTTFSNCQKIGQLDSVAALMEVKLKHQYFIEMVEILQVSKC